MIELEGPKTVSAIILEPVMLTAGVHMPPQEFFVGLRELCDEHGVLLIYDEIVTGVGRLGHWSAAELLEVWPDILCLGKGLSSGYAPLSAVLLTEQVADAFWGDAHTGTQYQAGHTFAGNPVAAACGLAVIRYIEEHNVFENVLARGQELRTHLESLAGRSPIIQAVRGRGLLYCLDFANPATGQPYPDQTPVGTAVQLAARERGLLVRASPQNLTIAPPLTVSSAEVSEAVDILGASVAEVSSKLTGGTLDVEVAFGL
jgi:adenosylmethionine-8-amino-7-oxononanoate aminotransferase